MHLSGYVDEISRGLITGWAIDLDDPARSPEIIISVNGEVCSSVPANRHRPGVGERMKAQIKAELHNAIAGAYGLDFTFNPPLSAFREHDIEVVFADTGQRLTLGSKRLHAPKPGKTDLVPLLVSSTGRSGSTLLMQHLARHPAIVVADRYPFEIKLISYYARAYEIMVAGADREKSSNPDTIVADPYFIGFNPYNRPGFYSIAKDRGMMEEFFETTVPQTFIATFGQLLSGYYGGLKADQGKSGARYFAEKINPDATARSGSRLLCGDARELLLIRDPRDILCSAKAFWKADPDSAAAGIARSLEQLQAIHDAGAADTMLIRYEDLILRSDETLAEIHKFLDLGSASDPGDAASGQSLFARHGTSATPASSIGRWKVDLTKDEIAACQRTFAPILERFGYTT
jgi:Sulfotransferase family